MKYLILLGSFLLGLLIAFYLGYQVTHTPKISGDVLFLMVQNWRDENGLTTLKRDKDLCNLASVRAEQIKQDFSHKGFYTSDRSQLKEYRVLGENLARDFPDEMDYFLGWMGSPGHRENIEYPYTHSCLICDEGYCVQEFGLLY
jgi:uncharacterized protein YkwD